MLNIYIIYMLNSPQRFEYGIWKKKKYFGGGEWSETNSPSDKKTFFEMAHSEWHIMIQGFKDFWVMKLTQGLNFQLYNE